ncbi:MAG: hotdog domain-containing protein [Myxococcota bacterium]|nr:hotdog domain-containing protein [Myxococcota bacterium]
MTTPIKTHLSTNASLCGTPVEVTEGSALVELETTQAMVVDDHGLVHGGFIFGLADYAAMLSINHPHVVLGAATTKFLKPTRVGDVVRAHARLSREDGKKKIVEVTVKQDDTAIFEGEFICFVPQNHVLD